MKRFITGLMVGCAVGIVLTLVVVFGSAFFDVGPLRLAPTMTNPTEPSFDAAEAGGVRVELGGDHGRKVIITRGSDSFVFIPQSNHVCANPVVRNDGHEVFLIDHEISGFGYNYASLLRFAIPDSSLALTQTTHEVFLTMGDLESLFGGKQTWINRVHQVSPDGERLLLNISSEDPGRSSGMATYYSDKPYWYWIAANRVEQIGSNGRSPATAK